MNKTDLLEIFTRQQRIEVDYPDIKREVEGSVIRHISLAGEDGFVIYSKLDEESVEAAISAQIARFQSIPQDFEWKVYDYDPPKNLIDRLRRRGFEIDEPEALLMLDLSAGPEALDRPAPPTVVRIADPGDIDAVVRLENAVWGTDHHDLEERLKLDLQEHPEMLSVYLSYQGEQPASAAWIYFHTGSSFASLWGGSTLPQFRSQGHYSHLLAARAQEAWARGFTLLSVDASPMSRPILEKHGFQYLATSTPCKWMVAKDQG
jgi:ribosomal protein S18 acetylase RimI-like enzyme